MKRSSELLELFLATFSLLHLEHVEPHCLTEGPALADHHQVTWLNVPAEEREEEEEEGEVGIYYALVPRPCH